jgi:hypothetical protein
MLLTRTNHASTVKFGPYQRQAEQSQHVAERPEEPPDGEPPRDVEDGECEQDFHVMRADPHSLSEMHGQSYAANVTIGVNHHV